ncbi:MAG: cupin domain-containing protein [Terrimonas sp.]|nr:cupin domain-containing protein [Terrimonas sp.]
MSEELILLIGERIKSLRARKNFTLDQLAGKAAVSKSLISQIENNRVVPSLPVLLALIHSLDVGVKDFFEEMEDYFSNEHVIIIRNNQGTVFQKEPEKGLKYKRLLTKNILSQTIDIVLIEIKPGAARKKYIKTEAFECKYVLSGTVAYQIENNTYNLEPGDVIFFDGRVRHRLKNSGKTEAKLLVFYFFS